MGDATTTVDTYLATWNETDPKRRSQLIERAWADGGRYVDPMLEAQGHAALGEMVAGVQAQVSRTPLPPTERCRHASRPAPLRVGPGDT